MTRMKRRYLLVGPVASVVREHVLGPVVRMEHGVRAQDCELVVACCVWNQIILCNSTYVQMLLLAFVDVSLDELGGLSPVVNGSHLC